MPDPQRAAPRFAARRSRAAAAILMAALGAACAKAPATPTPPTTSTSIVGTSTSTTTVTTALSTRTLQASATTITTVPTIPTTVAPPPSTPEPAPVRGTCPYLSDAEVMEANGQHTGPTSIIDVRPYPVCIFTRADGRYLATTRIVVAATPEQAVAAVNQHVPIALSSPATHPTGWTGGAMATPDGVPGYPDAASIYAVSKGPIAIIAISNQKQSIKGRQMVQDIVSHLGR